MVEHPAQMQRLSRAGAAVDGFGFRPEGLASSRSRISRTSPRAHSVPQWRWRQQRGYMEMSGANQTWKAPKIVG